MKPFENPCETSKYSSNYSSKVGKAFVAGRNTVRVDQESLSTSRSGIVVLHPEKGWVRCHEVLDSRALDARTRTVLDATSLSD